MGPFSVELRLEVIETGLLLKTVLASGSGGFGFKSAVHALMPAVLLGVTGLDALNANTKSKPPDTKLGKIVKTIGRSKGNPIV